VVQGFGGKEKRKERRGREIGIERTPEGGEGDARD
jgi:hypothetical protein